MGAPVTNGIHIVADAYQGDPMLSDVVAAGTTSFEIVEGT